MTLASPWFSPSGAFFGLARIMSAMDTPAFFFGGAKAGRFLTKRSIEAVRCVSVVNGQVLCYSGQRRGYRAIESAATSWTFPPTLLAKGGTAAHDGMRDAASSRIWFRIISAHSCCP